MVCLIFIAALAVEYRCHITNESLYGWLKPGFMDALRLFRSLIVLKGSPGNLRQSPMCEPYVNNDEFVVAAATVCPSIDVVYWGGNTQDGIAEWIHTGKNRPYFIVRDAGREIVRIVRKEHHICGSVSSGSEPRDYWSSDKEDEDDDDEESGEWDSDEDEDESG